MIKTIYLHIHSSCMWLSMKHFWFNVLVPASNQNQIQTTDDTKLILNPPIVGEKNPWLAEMSYSLQIIFPIHHKIKKDTTIPILGDFIFFNKMSAHLASATVRFLSSTVVPKVRASISSVPVAYTLPALTRAAHCASASPGAYNKSQLCP